MNQHSTTPSPQRIYTVDAESTTGVAISTYIRRCLAAKQALYDFLPTIAEYDFPIPVTPDTTYLTSDDCDAGGLLAIIVHQTDIDQMSQRANVLWDTMPCPSDDDPDAIAIFPRIEAKSHYIRYSRAVRLHYDNAPDFEFLPPSAEDKKKDRVLRTVTLDSVRRTISKEDLAALAHKGKTPDPTSKKILLAPARHFELPDIDLTSFPEEDRKQLFADAVRLHKAFFGLPTVSANSLVRTLQLDGKDIKHPYCEYNFDETTHQYIIKTNLSSSLVDMKETTKPD